MALDSKESELAQWFNQEVHPHEPMLRAALRRSFPVTDVDDLVQESYLRIWRAREKGPIRSGKRFLFAIARNAVRDLIRRRTVVEAVAVNDGCLVPLLEEHPGVADTVTHRQELDLLAEAVRTLPERCREVFLLRKIQGLSQREISQRLSISENTVETLVARGARRCADYFRERGLATKSRHEQP